MELKEESGEQTKHTPTVRIVGLSRNRCLGSTPNHNTSPCHPTNHPQCPAMTMSPPTLHSLNDYRVSQTSAISRKKTNAHCSCPDRMRFCGPHVIYNKSYKSQYVHPSSIGLCNLYGVRHWNLMPCIDTLRSSHCAMLWYHEWHSSKFV